MSATSADDLTVFIVEPDTHQRDALTLALGARGLAFQQFSSAAEFTAEYRRDWLGCLISELLLPDGNGEDWLRTVSLPLILTGQQIDLAAQRRAFLGGAVDVLSKPLDLEELLGAIDRAFTRQRNTIKTPPVLSPSAQHEVLTRRELEVARLVRRGFDNRSVAETLGISHRTVEVHKTRVMRKLGVRKLAELIALPLDTTKRARRTGKAG